MKKDKGFFLTVLLGGMELCWISAWAHWLTLLILQRPFPFSDGIGIFAIAAVFTRLLTGRGWRIIWVLSIQILGFAFSGLRIVYLFESSSLSFLDWGWVIHSFNTSRTPLEWVILFYLLSWPLFLWISGVRFAKRPIAYLNVCSRFDLGLGAFFLLYLTKMTLFVKGGVTVSDPVSEYLVLSFFLFGLLAIGWARDRGKDRKDFLPGYQGFGMILIFAAVVILFGTALTLFFWAYLNVAAEAGYSGLRIAARPIGSFLVMIIRFLYFRDIHRPNEPSASKDSGSGEIAGPMKEGGLSEFWEKALSYGLFAVIGLLFAVILGLAAFYLLRWLFSRTSVNKKKVSGPTSLPDWIKRCRVFLLGLWSKAIRSIRRPANSIQFFAGLLRWGRRSGMPHQTCQTPAEYGARLKHRFPQLDREIDRIIEAFNLEVYGELSLSRGALMAAESAWRKLRSPRHWPARVRNRFTGRSS
jgi:hypothetical protein